MKPMQYKIFSCLALWLCCATVFAATDEKTEVIEYAISKDASVELKNQYGDVEILGWEKDSIRIEATISVSSSNFMDLNKLMDMVEISSRGSMDDVFIATVWAAGNNVFKQRAMDLKKLFKTDKKLTVDYKIYMPTTCRLTISNRFGNIYLPNYSGALRVDLTHGDVRARILDDIRHLAVKYGKASIKEVKNALLKIEFGSLILDKADNLTLRSKSSSIEIIEVNNLAITSRNDDLRIDQVNSLRGESNFSHIRAKQVLEKVNLITHYGDVTLKEINKSITSIQMNGTNTDYDLEFNEDAVYRYNVLMIGKRSLDFNISGGIKLLTQDMIDDENRFKGYQGDEKATVEVDITSKGGYVNLGVH